MIIYYLTTYQVLPTHTINIIPTHIHIHIHIRTVRMSKSKSLKDIKKKKILLVVILKLWGQEYDMIWYDIMWYDMIWYDIIWYDMIGYDIIVYILFTHLYTNIYFEKNSIILFISSTINHKSINLDI